MNRNYVGLGRCKLNMLKPDSAGACLHRKQGVGSNFPGPRLARPICCDLQCRGVCYMNLGCKEGKLQWAWVYYEAQMQENEREIHVSIHFTMFGIIFRSHQPLAGKQSLRRARNCLRRRWTAKYLNSNINQLVYFPFSPIQY